MNVPDSLLRRIAVRDARDQLERATGWIVQIHGIESGLVVSTYGPFEQPGAALVWAEELDVTEEEGFVCTVRAIMPAL